MNDEELLDRYQAVLEENERLRAEYEPRLRAESAIRSAAEALLRLVREKHPDDFKPGGRGYICPYHKRLARALRGEVDDDE